MFRGSAKGFSSDPLALSFARHALDKGFEKELPHSMRLFVALPLMHAEDLQAQKECVQLVTRFAEELQKELPELERETAGKDNVQFAIWHEDIIKQFGRFPHRNAVLGRTPTQAELDYLANGGRTF